MKSVLISIRPEWCKKILGGEKTTEIRKSRPNLETPFRCYIYCTKSAGRFAIPSADGKPVESAGKIIGEFTCDKIRFYSGKSWLVKEDIENVTAGSCLSLEQVKEYAGWRKATSFVDRKDLYSWHISDLKVYDEPRTLEDFSRHGFQNLYGSGICGNEICKYYNPSGGWMQPPECELNGPCRFTRPPQSWCYVEEKDIVDLLLCSNDSENGEKNEVSR